MCTGLACRAVAPVLPVQELLRLVLLVVHVFCQFSCPFGVFYVLPKFQFLQLQGLVA